MRRTRSPRWPAAPPPASPSMTRSGVARLLDSLRVADAQDQVTALLDRDPAARVSLDDPGGVARAAGQPAGGGRAGPGHHAGRPRSAARVSVDDPVGVATLLDSLREVDAQDQVTALASRAAAHVPLDNPIGVAELAAPPLGGRR